MISSWTLTGVAAQYVPSQTMYGEDGEHGDVPIFLAFADATGDVIPSIEYSYNTVYLSPNTFGSTGIPTFNRNSNLGTVNSSTLNNNVSVTNLNVIQNATGGGGTAGAVFGDDAAMIYDAFNVSANFFDPTGAANCFLLNFSTTGGGVGPTITGSVNMLGDGSGNPDPLANS